MQAYPVPKANQAYTIKALTELMAAYRSPKSPKATRVYTSQEQWHESEPRTITLNHTFHLPYNPMGEGLIEWNHVFQKLVSGLSTSPCRGRLQDYMKY